MKSYYCTVLFAHTFAVWRLRFLLPSLATGFLSQANLLSREPKRASCSRLRATGWSPRATTRLKNPPMPSAAAANEIPTFATIVDSPPMVYARRGALHLPSNLSPDEKVAWAKSIANNLIGGLLVDKSSTIYLPSKVHRGDRIKLSWLDSTSTLKEKVIQVDQLEKAYVIAVRGQPPLASDRVCPKAPLFHLKNI